jgi:hypothetical protein
MRRSRVGGSGHGCRSDSDETQVDALGKPVRQVILALLFIYPSLPLFLSSSRVHTCIMRVEKPLLLLLRGTLSLARSEPLKMGAGREERILDRENKDGGDKRMINGSRTVKGSGRAAGTATVDKWDGPAGEGAGAAVREERV